jgi:hypothetical protein
MSIALHKLTWDEILSLCAELAPDVQWNSSRDSLEEAFSKILEFRLRVALLGVIMFRSEAPDDMETFDHWREHLQQALEDSAELHRLS